MSLNDYLRFFFLDCKLELELDRVFVLDLSFTKIWTDGRIAPVARIQNWWAQSITDGTPVIPGLVEGLASQIVCDKVKESNSIGMKIEIN